MVISSLFFPSKRFILNISVRTKLHWIGGPSRFSQNLPVIAEKINIQIRGLFKIEIFFQKM